MPWSWAAHPLFAAEAGDPIVLPAINYDIAPGRLRRATSRSGRRHHRLADRHPRRWRPDRPSRRATAAITASATSSLRARSAPDGKLVRTSPTVKAGMRIRVRFDSAATPYLGLWICYGGWPDRPGPKQNCVALEPSTAPVDSLAQTGPWSRVLEPGQSFSWPMSVDFEII